MFDPKNRILIVLAAIAAAVALLAMQFTEPAKTPPSAETARAALTETMRDVAKRWPTLPHVATDKVAARLSEDDFLLIDSRSEEEYKVSRVPGAVHVAPDISADAFFARFGDRIQGKDVMFYCSVGVRSSTLASKLAEDLKAKGAKSVAEMAGGIFAWHNEDRPLVNGNGPTDLVHSYDDWWGRLVARQDKTRQ